MKKRPTDKDRLDWLSGSVYRSVGMSHLGRFQVTQEDPALAANVLFSVGPTIREAIDAAMREEDERAKRNGHTLSKDCKCGPRVVKP